MLCPLLTVFLNILCSGRYVQAEEENGAKRKNYSHPEKTKAELFSFVHYFLRSSVFSLVRAISLLAAQACCVHNVRVFVKNEKAGVREEI